MNRYKLRNRTHFPQPLVRPIYNCQESLTYLDTKRWEIVFIGRKQTETLFEFKKKVKQWVCIMALLDAFRAIYPYFLDKNNLLLKAAFYSLNDYPRTHCDL